eukprot:2625169-Rhodomonas_salina.1
MAQTLREERENSRNMCVLSPLCLELAVFCCSRTRSRSLFFLGLSRHVRCASLQPALCVLPELVLR